MISATRRPVAPLPSDKAVCGRCGIVRTVNESRPVSPLCRDCLEVEAAIEALATPTRPRCGTLRGYTIHNRLREPACEDCRGVMREYRRKYRARKAAA